MIGQYFVKGKFKNKSILQNPEIVNNGCYINTLTQEMLRKRFTSINMFILINETNDYIYCQYAYNNNKISDILNLKKWKNYSIFYRQRDYELFFL